MRAQDLCMDHDGVAQLSQRRPPLTEITNICCMEACPKPSKARRTLRNVPCHVWSHAQLHASIVKRIWPVVHLRRVPLQVRGQLLIERLYKAGLADAALCNDHRHARATESTGRWVTRGALFKETSKLCKLGGATVEIWDGRGRHVSTPRHEIRGTSAVHCNPDANDPSVDQVQRYPREAPIGQPFERVLLALTYQFPGRRRGLRGLEVPLETAAPGVSSGRE